MPIHFMIFQTSGPKTNIRGFLLLISTFLQEATNYENQKCISTLLLAPSGMSAIFIYCLFEREGEQGE